MNILIAAATHWEIKPLIAFLNRQVDSFQNLSVDIKITGVGVLATTYSLCRQLSLKKYDQLYQIGVAGCFDKSIPLGTVFLVNKDTMGDEGVEEKKQLCTLFDMKLINPSQHPYHDGWLVNPHVKKSRIAPTANGITVNKITTGVRAISLLREKFNPTLETMEGAAFHYAGLMEKTPFLQLRATSNYAGERNKKKWLMQQAIENVNNTFINQFILPLAKL
jgi:futalosine hydrolase